MKGRIEIQKLRKQLGVSQERFAKMLGVSFMTVNRWEKGLFTPSPMAEEKLDQILSNHRRKLL